MKYEYSRNAWPPSKVTTNHTLHTESTYKWLHSWHLLWSGTFGSCACDDGAITTAVGYDTVVNRRTHWDTNSWSPLKYSMFILNVSHVYVIRWFQHCIISCIMG